MADHKPLFEGLEPRLMLTTLVGGDVFEYMDANEQTIRISLDGDIIAELIASDLDDANNLLLGDMPGRIYSSSQITGRAGTNILGGVGGADGVEVIGGISITDAEFGPGSISFSSDGLDTITLQALASMGEEGNGRSFAFNIAEVEVGEETQTIIQLLELSNTANDSGVVEGDVSTMLQDASLREDVMSTLDAALAGTPSAFAIGPTGTAASGVAYAIVNNSLVSINRYTGATTNIGATGLTDVNAMEFDSTGNLWAIGRTGGNAVIVQLNTATGAVSQQDNIRTEQGDPPAFANSTGAWTAMVFNGTTAYAVEAGTTLYSIETAALGGGGNADASRIGTLQTGGDSATAASIQGMAYTQNAAGNTILVGVDHQTDDNGATQARLVTISTTTATVSPLTPVGGVMMAEGLSSFTEAGDSRSLLFAANTTSLVRGTAISLPRGGEGTLVSAIQGADFRPYTGSANDGRLFFTVSYEATVGEETVNRVSLYSIDVNKTSRSAILNSLTFEGTMATGEDAAVTSLAWEVNSGTATLYGFFTGTINEESVGRIVTVNENSGGMSTVVSLARDGEAITSITGIEFVNDDVTAGEDYIYAVENNGADSQLLRINLATGNAYVIGPLSDPDDTSDPIAGEDLQGLAWNPAMLNPFSGEYGALIATDASSDELVIIDFRPRFPTSDVFAIYVSQAGVDAQISMAVVPDAEEDPRPMQPFEGSVGDLRITPANSSVTIVSALDGTGGLYIGARTEDISDDIGDEDLIPLIAGELAEEIGVRAQGVDDWTDDDTADLASGVVVSENLLRYLSGEDSVANRLLGQNLDEITGVAVMRDGTIYVVDSDRVDASGQSYLDLNGNGQRDDGEPNLGDQIAYVSGTGVAETPYAVIDATTGLPLKDVAAVDFGDVAMAGPETLYAVYNIDNPVPSDSLGALGGTPVVTGLTVTVGGQTYAVHNEAGTFHLYQYERDDTGAVTAVTDLGSIIGVNAASAIVDITDISALEANPQTGLLYVVGLHGGAGNQFLFQVPTVATDVSNDGTADELLAVELADLGTTDTVEAFAVDPLSMTGYAVFNVLGIHTLASISLADGTVTPIGAITVGGAAVTVEAMDFRDDGVLMAIDDTGNRIIMIDPVNPANSREIAAAVTNRLGFAADRTGLFYSVDSSLADYELLVSPGATPTLGILDTETSIAGHVPDHNVGGDIGDLNSPEALTIIPDADGGLGEMYLINDNGAGFELIHVNRDDQGVVTGTDAPIGIVNYTEIGALTAYPDPIFSYMLAVGLDGVTGDQTLILLDETGLVAPIGALDAGVLQAGDICKGLTFDSNGTLWAVVFDAGLGADVLYTISLTSGAATAVGLVEVSGAGTDVDGMAFDLDGRLIAIDRSGGAGAARLIEIDTTDPLLSTAETGAGSVPDELAGLDMSTAGLFYSVFNNVAPTNDEIWVSAPSAAQFTTVSPLALAGVKAMAYSPGPGSDPTQQGLYVIDDNNVLYEVNPSTGALLTGGDNVENADGEAVSISSMNFDQLGVLWGHDNINGRLVDIDISTIGSGTVLAGEQVATTDGSLRPTIGGIAYDQANDRLLTADNSMSLQVLANEGAEDTDPTDATTPDDSAAMMVLRTDEATGTYTSNAAWAQSVDSMLFGGTVTGKVDITGSINTFYAGWLLTGDAAGQAEAEPTIEDNFIVGRDIRNLLVLGPVGNDGTYADTPLDPTYVSGFDLQVGGKVGQFWSQGTLIGQSEINNTWYQTNHVMLSNLVYEIENRPNESAPDAEDEGEWFQDHMLFMVDGTWNNDTFETAQYLAPTRFDSDDRVVLSGTIQGDPAGDNTDYYSLALLAGQTVTVQLSDDSGMLDVGVFDPDGRLIATDVNDVNAGVTNNAPFSFTADRPGLYRFAVGGAPFDGSTSYDGTFPYVLIINDIGDLTIGAMAAHSTGQAGNETAVNIYNPAYYEPFLRTQRGDVGAIVAGDSILSEVLGSMGGIDVELNDPTGGSLRTLYASATAYGTDSGFGGGLNIKASGSGGLFQTTDSSGYLQIKRGRFGGDVQLIDAAGTLLLGTASLNQPPRDVDLTDETAYAGLYIDQGLGVIRAGNMATDPASVIMVNFDRAGNDGVIDLIDVDGDFGTLGTGGPQITTGPGGNVRYMRVGGAIYQDSMFGSGDYTGTTLDPGESLDSFTDDSGGKIYVKPVAVLTDINGNPIDDTGQPLAAEDYPFLTYRVYGIRGAGGSVLVDVTSTGSVAIGSTTAGNNGGVEIGQIITTGTGRATNVDVDGSFYQTPNESPARQQDLNVSIKGDTTVDVFSIEGGDFSNVHNYTGGEIVNISASSIWSLAGKGQIGLASDSTGAAINRIAPLGDDTLANTYPFNQQTIGVYVSGNVATISTNGAVGNILVSGSIGSVAANASGVVDHTDGQFDGIAAPVYGVGGIGSVTIGEGIAPSGTGQVAYSGLYSDGEIGRVVGSGSGANIWGDIIGGGGIGAVVLNGGSIINADLIAGPLEGGQEIGGLAMSADLGPVTVAGNGGIIGSSFYGINVGNITVSGGFGLLNSIISTVEGNGDIGNITVDGYGVRSVMLNSGRNTGNITATGRGDYTAVTNFNSTVRQSLGDLVEWDPLFNTRLNSLNDLYQFLGVTPATAVVGTQDLVGGTIANSFFSGLQDLGTVQAYQIYSDTGVPTTFDFANSIDGFITYTQNATSTVAPADFYSLDNVQITTGQLTQFRPAWHVNAMDMNIAGTINLINIRGSLLGDSSITASGPNAYINTVLISGDLAGSISSSGWIGLIRVGGDMSGNIEVIPSDGSSAFYSLRTLLVSGSYSGSMDIQGNVGLLRVDRDFGADGDILDITGNLYTLMVGYDASNPAVAEMALDLNVTGDFYTMLVTGQVSGTVYVGGDMRTMIVNRDANAAVGSDLLTGEMRVHGDIYTLLLNGGNLAGRVTTGNGILALKVLNGDIADDVTAGGDIRTLFVLNGDIAAGAEVTSSFGDIYTVTISGGDLFGALRAPHGQIRVVSILGSDLKADSRIEADSMTLLNVAGNIEAGASVNVAGELMTLLVGGDIQADSNLNIGSARTVQVRGDLLGSLGLGYGPYGSTIIVFGDLSGNLSVDADTRLTVMGNVLAGTDIAIGRDLQTLLVTGNLGTVAANPVSVIVDGGANLVRAGALNGAIITTGFDLNTLLVTGNVNASLVQTGISRGDDKQFGVVDPNGTETSRTGQLKVLNVGGTMTDSVLSAGGSILTAIVSDQMDNSSVTSGLSVGGTAVSDVLDGTIDLTAVGGTTAARNGADLELLTGGITVALMNGGMVNSSYVAAGVDPTDGVFGDGNDVVTTSVTGGNSGILKMIATMDGTSAVVTDGAITVDSTTGGTVTTDIGNAGANDFLTDITAGEGSALPAFVISASQGNGINLNNVDVNVVGPGFVDLYDVTGAANSIDAIVFRGTTRATRITINSAGAGGAQIGRMLSLANTDVGTITLDGDLVGDGVAASPDLWLDGDVTTLSLDELGSAAIDPNYNGKIGGDVLTMSMNTQNGFADVRVGGTINNLTIGQGTDALLSALGALAADQQVTSYTYDSTGQAYVFMIDGGAVTEQLYTVTPATGVLANATDITTALDPATAMTLLGADFDSGDALYAAADMYNYTPSAQVGSMSDTALTDFRALASNASGTTYAIDTTGGVDQLVRFLDDGSFVVVGTLQDLYDHTYAAGTGVEAMAFDASGTLFAIVADRDGSGAGAAGATIVRVATTADADGFVQVTSPTSPYLPGVQLDGGGVTNNFNGMTIDGTVGSGETIYLVRRDVGDTQDTLVTVNSTTGAQSDVGLLQVAAADTHIIGIGLDENGNLLAYNNDGASAEMLYLAAADLAVPGNLQYYTPAGSLSTAIDAFAVDKLNTGGGYGTWAYDFDDVVGGVLYTNPGTVATIGTIDADPVSGTYGEFTALRPLAGNAQGESLSGDVISVAVDAAASDRIFVLTDNGNLYAYAQDGSFLALVGTIRDANDGSSLDITQIEFMGTTLIGLDATNNRLVSIAVDLAATEQLGTVSAIGTALTTAVTSTGTVYTVYNNAGTPELYRIDRATDGSIQAVNQVGTVEDGAANTINGIGAMEINGTTGYVIGTTGAVGVGDMGLYTIDLTTGQATLVADLDGGGVTDSFVALALRNSTLYGLRNVGGTHTLYTINTSDGTLSEVVGVTLGSGAVEVGGLAVTVSGMDVDATGALLAIGTVAGDANPSIIRINLDDPGDSLQLIAATAGLANATDMAVDSDGRYYTIDSAGNVLLGSTAGLATPQLQSGTLAAQDLTALGYDPTTTTLGSFQYSTTINPGSFVSFTATTQADLTSLTAASVTTMNLGTLGDYDARVETTGNTFRIVNISDDFGGSIYTPGDILIVRQTAGIFTGSLQAGGAITSALLSGSLNEGGRIVAGDYFNYISVAGNVDGRIAAQQLRTVSVSGNVLDDGTLQSTSDLWTLLVGGTFAGSGVFDGARLINLTGAITATGSLSSTGDVTSVLLRGGMNAGSSLMIEGMANVINAGGTISGLIAVQGGANVAMVTNVTNGLIVIAENTRMFRAMGDVNDSVISFGTWIGSDGAYNTADDSITGGSVVYANIVGDFLNSALVAGVLPNVNYGPGLPADIADAYYGSEDRTTLDETDAAEAGGIFLSEFTTVVFGDDIQDFLGGGGQSVLAAADGIGRILTYAPIGSLLTRTYNDPYLAPTVQVNKTDLLDTNNLFVYFSEELASGSLSLSQDNNNDGDLTDPGDVQGSVTLRDMSDNILDEDVTLYYYATEDDDGQSVGLLQIVGTDLFTEDIRLTLSGSLTGPAIYDRSGMRSALRDYNQDGVESPGEDIWQTILDGEGDGTEGGDYSVVISVVDRANTFEAALEAGPITLQVDGVTQLQSKFSSSEDIDIFYFTGTEFEYFSSAFTSFSGVQAALFYQDTQGTATLDDDFYELVARYERTSYYGDLANFQAWELHATGNYFLVLAPDGFSAEVSYSLDLTYGTTDTNLVSLLPGGSLPTGEQIAYVSSTVGEHNNNLGALEKKQLVYLNFEGGTADKYDVGDVSIDELDLADIDVTLDGQEDTLINGGVYDGQTITGIVDLVLDVYENTAASYLDAQGQPRNLNVDRITTLAEWTAGTEGLYFTTVDPATWGLDPDADYTTCFVGDADDSVFGASLYGIASTVDWTNVSKADNAITFAQNFQGLAAAATAAGRLQQYARALANTTAHELGHVLGLNHQPTSYEPDSWILLADDPDNDPNTPDDSNSGAGLMAYATSDVKISVLLELGTNVITSREFPTGWIDTQDLVMRWLTT